MNKLLLLLILFAFKAYPQAKTTFYNNHYKYPSIVHKKIDTVLLGQCFALEVTKYVDRGGRVSNRIKNINFTNKVVAYNSLRNYLSRYENHSLYQTGHEDKIDAWILKQNDNTVDPLKIFKTSFELNKGDLFRTFLTIYNSLYRNARWYKDMVTFESSYERMYSYFNKFVDIRGDLDDRNGGTGDHIGTWYRIWGMMAFYIYSTGYHFENKMEFSFMSGEDFEAKLEAAYDFSIAHAELAEQIKSYMKYAWWNNGNKWDEIDTRKTEFNKAGVKIASEFILSLYSTWNINLSIHQKACDRSEYIF